MKLRVIEEVPVSKTKPWSDLWSDVDQALTKESAQKELKIETYASGSEIFFEAKIPRHANNNLGMSATWQTSSREDAAAFLRALADLIEKETTS